MSTSPSNPFQRYAPLASSTFLAVVAILRFLGQNEAADAAEQAKDSVVVAYAAVLSSVGVLYGVYRKIVSLARG
jgi:hypothetical protein